MNLLAFLQSINRVTLIGSIWIISVLFNSWMLPRHYATHADIETLKKEPLPLMVWSSGNLEAKESLTAKAQFDGPIMSKSFHEGQEVKKGQLLMIMSRDRIRLDYQTKYDGLKNAEADLTKARKDLKLQKLLYQKEAVSYSSVEDAETDLVKKTQALAGAKETFRLELQQWNSANIYAPFDGTVVKDSLGDQKFVKSDSELFTVADVSQYTMHVQVDELDIKQVHEGQKAEVRLQIYKDVTLPAVVSEIGSQSEGAGLPTVSVTLLLTDWKGLKLRPKLTGEARIATGKTEPILSVPTDAIANNDGEPHVWVVGFLNKIHPVSVTLGRTNPDRAEVTAGLHAGDRICESAEPEYSDGMRVTPEGASTTHGSKTHALISELHKHEKPKTPVPTARNLFGMAPKSARSAKRS